MEREPSPARSEATTAHYSEDEYDDGGGVRVAASDIGDQHIHPADHPMSAHENPVRSVTPSAAAEYAISREGSLKRSSVDMVEGQAKKRPRVAAKKEEEEKPLKKFKEDRKRGKEGEAEKRARFLALPGVVNASPTEFDCHCGRTIQLRKDDGCIYSERLYKQHMRACKGPPPTDFTEISSQEERAREERRRAFLELPGVVNVTTSHYECHCGVTLALRHEHCYDKTAYNQHRRFCKGPPPASTQDVTATLAARRHSFLLLPHVLAADPTFFICARCRTRVQLNRRGNRTPFYAYRTGPYHAHMRACVGEGHEVEGGATKVGVGGFEVKSEYPIGPARRGRKPTWMREGALRGEKPTDVMSCVPVYTPPTLVEVEDVKLPIDKLPPLLLPPPKQTPPNLNASLPLKRAAFLVLDGVVSASPTDFVCRSCGCTVPLDEGGDGDVARAYSVRHYVEHARVCPGSEIGSAGGVTGPGISYGVAAMVPAIPPAMVAEVKIKVEPETRDATSTVTPPLSPPNGKATSTMTETPRRSPKGKSAATTRTPKRSPANGKSLLKSRTPNRAALSKTSTLTPRASPVAAVAPVLPDRFSDADDDEDEIEIDFEEPQMDEEQLRHHEELARKRIFFLALDGVDFATPSSFKCGTCGSRVTLDKVEGEWSYDEAAYWRHREICK
ncbi:hypothetical protein HK101_005823 [Irineochytrium annulatum]|nr:hypothetical protein HK101_005823 [Irineochytrium annulatum]